MVSGLQELVRSMGEAYLGQHGWGGHGGIVGEAAASGMQKYAQRPTQAAMAFSGRLYVGKRVVWVGIRRYW